MTPQKIQSIYSFIDFLDSKKLEYIDKYVPICNELTILASQKNKLDLNKNYIEKQKYDNIQAEIEEKFSPIITNVYIPVTSKLKEFEIWTGDEDYSSIWNNNIGAIYEFKSNFKSEDIEKVMSYKNKYLNFRKETNTEFLSLTMVFDVLDEILKELFDFFKNTEENEFEGFETKTIKINSIEEAAKGIKESLGTKVKFSLPTNILHNSLSELHKRDIAHGINNEIIMGDKIQVGDILNESGQVSVGKDIVTNASGSEELSKKSFSWQKWGIVIGTILALIAIVIALYN